VLSVIGEANLSRQPDEEPLEDDFSFSTTRETDTESSRASVPSIPSSEDESNGLVEMVDSKEIPHESESDEGSESGDDDRTVQLGIS